MKPGRNDPCPCGSGKKYKHCCLAREEAIGPEELAWRRVRRAIETAAGRASAPSDAPLSAKRDCRRRGRSSTCGSSKRSRSTTSRLTCKQQAQRDRRAKQSAGLAAQPELRAAVTELLRKHYRAGVDDKIPALGDRTPREAVRDADGREAVAALIDQIERDGPKMNPPLDPQIVRELRETLGLNRG